MILTLVAIWAIVLPVAILAITWQAARLRDAQFAVRDRSVPRVAPRRRDRCPPAPAAPRGRAGRSRVASARSCRAARDAARRPA